ncbi:MAG: alpha/beta hydrolase [Acidimicrobiia bacterium]
MAEILAPVAGSVTTMATSRLGAALLHATLWVTPYPMARAVRRQFAASGAATNQALEAHVPDDVEWWFDEPYGTAPHEVYDLYRPFDPDGTRPVLPAIVWVHGGGFVGGDKGHLRGWCCILASRGFAVVAPRYTLAPEVAYPAPVQQVVDVLGHLTRDAAAVGVDPDRIVVAGDSAGAQIAAQAAAVVADPAYADASGVVVAEGTPVPAGAVLCCGPYDLALVRPGKGLFADFETCCMWSYAGTRSFRTSRDFTTMSVVDHVSPAFPPTFVTVGNADPLAPHTESLVRALEAQGVAVEQACFAADHQPALEHEYQFDLSLADARDALARIVAFAEARTR